MASRPLKILGFMIAYPAASFVAMLSLVATQGLTGHEGPLVLLLGYTVGWFVLFGLAGSLPVLIAADAVRVEDAATRSASENFAGFGAGGGVAGALIGTMLITGRLGGSAGAVLVAFAIPFTVPWALGLALSPVILPWIRRSR